jgi:hypothetical protein
MSEIKKAARDYLARGFSVIPCDDAKHPIRGWKEFQFRKPTKKEIDEWPENVAGVGIVTGKVSNLTVIDVDPGGDTSALSKLLGEDCVCPMAHTPRGGKHLYFLHSQAVTSAVDRPLAKIDTRSEGAVIQAPPTRGGAYKWDDRLNLETIPLGVVPNDFVSAFISTTVGKTNCNWVGDGKIFSDGRRNNDLFHLAYRLALGKEREEYIYSICKPIADWCHFPDRELRNVISSAIKQATREERNLSTEVKNFVGVTDGEFRVTEVAQALQVVTPQDKSALRQALHRLKKDGYITKSGGKDGAYVRVNKELTAIDWRNAPVSEFKVKLPLFLNSYVTIFPRNIIVVSGLNNAGKTAVALDIARYNQDIHPVRYFSSEMGDSELKIRLSKWEGIGEDEWKVKFFERSSDFAGVIDPDGLNIIDYLEVNDEFWKIGKVFTDLYDALRGGIAVVCLQKNPGSDYGRGGTFGAEKPRLYLSVDRVEGRNVMKMVKVKNWRGAVNPNGKEIYFKITGGWRILPDGDWHYHVVGGKK